MRPAFLLFFCLMCFARAHAQKLVFEKPRLTVSTGLPQSFISGLVQDKAGFIWIATLDGLTRYDGHSYKTFLHRPNDTSTLIANVITGLFLDKNDQLWLQYQGGGIDILNTKTEHLFHFTADPVYTAALSHVNNISSTVQDDQNRYWMLTDKQEIMRIDLPRHRLDIYHAKQLGITGGSMTGIGTDGRNIFIAADTALVIINSDGKKVRTVPFTFHNPHLADSRRSWKDNAPIIRPNGEVVIIDELRVIIYDPVKNTFLIRPLPARKLYQYPHRIKDSRGNIMFSYNRFVFSLETDNVLRVWQDSTNIENERPLSLLLDRSGVLWVGTNGYGLRQYDTRVPRMTYRMYQTNFPEDILKNNLVSSEMLSQTGEHAMIRFINPYMFRWAAGHDGKIWISRAGADYAPAPELYYYQNGNIFGDIWHYTDTASGSRTRISALVVSRSGKLWALDHMVRLISLNPVSHAATVIAQIPAGKITKSHNVNSLLIDGEDTCWITTSLGMLRYIISSAETKQVDGILPAGVFTTLTQDSNNNDILWIGSLGGGLIRFNKRDFSYKVYSMDDGLPNNTIYAILQHNLELWCSSNKGIFSFNTRTELVKDFTVADGLAEDEFNRFHFFRFPDGRFSFGGTRGYTVFDPGFLSNDSYKPDIVITGLKIHNRKADYGSPGSPLPASINSLDTLRLSYDQNFLTLDFAALEYNIPEKLQYRYKMEDLDGNWVQAGNIHSAVYTDLSPGKYVFYVNGTNSAGDWSTSVKKLCIIIRPPFWLSWWFITICTLMAIALIYIITRARFAEIRRQEQQKHRFEKEVIQLEALALRAQMNPHFIFNCLNSIKALIQENKNSQAIAYLTTFSKLIRNQLNNAQQEISLHDEIQTCKLYIKLEALRFSDKISCEFIIDTSLNLHAVKVPPLFLQPVIENAIWHGILPLKTNGKVIIRIEEKGDSIICTIDDNGVGRKQQKANTSKDKSAHNSKGMKLVEDRLRLHNHDMNAGNYLQVIDKKDLSGNSAGTTVIIKLNLKND